MTVFSCQRPPKARRLLSFSAPCLLEKFGSRRLSGRMLQEVQVQESLLGWLACKDYRAVPASPGKNEDLAEYFRQMWVGRGRPTCEEPPDGVPVSGVEAEGPRKTNPISAAPRGMGILSVNADPGRTRGQDVHATVPPAGGTANRMEVQGPACETNPISPGRDVGQVPLGPEVRADYAPGEPGENKANFPQPAAGEAVVCSARGPPTARLCRLNTGI